MPPSLASSTTVKRIHREIADLKKEDLGDITLVPTDNLFAWKATLPGPQGSPYEGGVFEVEIALPNDYPFSAPRLLFRTRIYHMNISDRGGVCVDILKHNWSPALSLFKVILSLSSLLTDPNPMDPLVPAIATEYVRNRQQHDKTARHWTQLYARPPPPLPPKAATPPPTPSQPDPTRRKGKGTARRSHPQANTAHLPVNHNELIVIDDSDDDSRMSTRSSHKRKREAPPANQTINLIDDDGIGDSSRGHRRRLSMDGAHEVNGVIIIE